MHEASRQVKQVSRRRVGRWIVAIAVAVVVAPAGELAAEADEYYRGYRRRRRRRRCTYDPRRC